MMAMVKYPVHLDNLKNKDTQDWAKGDFRNLKTALYI